MKQNIKKTIAFLYNIRHSYPDPHDPRSHLETDFDDAGTIDWIIKHIKNCGYNVLAVEANEKAYFKLSKFKNSIDLAFNYAEGIYGKDREAQMPAILEMLQIPYTGCRPLTCALLLNKAKTKEILRANNIPVSDDQIFQSGKEKLNKNFKFPLIVKPNSQGSSSGITNKSVVYDKNGLYKQIAWVINTFHSSTIVEPFLNGREFSVPLVGNPPQIFPYIEPDHKNIPQGFAPIDSLEIKWQFEENEKGKDHLMCPAKVDNILKTKIDSMCLSAWKALGIFDVCRIDVRCDGKGNPYILEVNFPAGLIPPEVSQTSYLPLSARSVGMDYESLIKKIIASAFSRYASK